MSSLLNLMCCVDVLWSWYRSRKRKLATKVMLSPRNLFSYACVAQINIVRSVDEGTQVLLMVAVGRKRRKLFFSVVHLKMDLKCFCCPFIVIYSVAERVQVAVEIMDEFKYVLLQ